MEKKAMRRVEKALSSIIYAISFQYTYFIISFSFIHDS